MEEHEDKLRLTVALCESSQELIEETERLIAESKVLAAKVKEARLKRSHKPEEPPKEREETPES